MINYRLLSFAIVCAALSACATTTLPTEGSESIAKTVNSALDVTSSTSGDDEGRSAKANEYMLHHYVRVKKDMAVGDGEHVRALAEIFGVASSKTNNFCAMTKAKYAQLFASTEHNSRRVVSLLEKELSDHPAKYN